MALISATKTQKHKDFTKKRIIENISISFSIKIIPNSGYYLGFGPSVTRRNLGKANEKHNYKIFEEFAYVLIEEVRRSCTNPIWNVDELESFYANIQPPFGEIQLNDWITINDLRQFIKGHFDIVKAQKGKRTFLPYYYRLQELRNYLETNKN